MEYNDILASSIQQKFNIRKRNLKIWKNKGYIPNNHFKESKIKVLGFGLREIRKKLGMKLEIAAFLIKVNGRPVGKTNLSRWESGLFKPRKKTILIIEEFYTKLYNKRFASEK